jgi:hypothetical protein
MTTLTKDKNGLLLHFLAMKHASLQKFLDILPYILHIEQKLHSFASKNREDN